MPGFGGILTVDVASRETGWAYDEVRGRAPVYGLWILPGTADTGLLWASYRNVLTDHVQLLRPARVVFAIPLMMMHANSRALIGLSVQTEVVCYDEGGILCNEVPESKARKEVLGRGNFAVYANGKPIKGTGTERAKIAVGEWARGRGWKPQTHDVADALCILEYAKLLELANAQWGRAA